MRAAFVAAGPLVGLGNSTPRTDQCIQFRRVTQTTSWGKGSKKPEVGEGVRLAVLYGQLGLLSAGSEGVSIRKAGSTLVGATAEYRKWDTITIYSPFYE